MGDKEIIIDGLDVSHCVHYCKNDKCGNTCHWFCTPCEWVNIKECIYKQLKRKEQECEKYKKLIDKMIDIRHYICLNKCDDLMKASHSCTNCKFTDLIDVINEAERTKQNDSTK